MSLDANLSEFIDGLPKAELHLHIEGTLEPEMALQKAGQKNIKLPFSTEKEFRELCKFERGLDDFLPLYYAKMQVLQGNENKRNKNENDFYDLGMAYFEKARANNIRHAEIFFDPQAHTNRVIGPSVPFEVPLYGLAAAQKKAREEFGITSGLIMCFLRHFDEEDAFKTLAQVKPHRDLIIGVGLDSGERGNPPSKFERVFAAARDEGLHVTAHAAEEGSWRNVWEVVNLLEGERVDHGNRLVNKSRNPEREKQRIELISLMKDQGIGLTMCPLSALALHGIEDMKKHPLKKAMRQGLLASVHSDDPAYFGGYINDNFKAAAGALGLTARDVTILARNSFEISFLGRQEKDAHLREIDDYVIAYGQRMGGGHMRTPAGIIVPN